MELKPLSRSASTQDLIDSFGGYNHNIRIQESEFYNTGNLTTDNLPVLSCRPKRGIVRQYHDVKAVLAKEQLMVVDGRSLYYGDVDITSYLTAKGVAISTEEPKQLVGMGAYAVLYPDRLYINTEDFEDCGSMENSVEITGDVSITMCNMEGDPYDDVVQGDVAPEEPQNGALWLDTSGETHFLRKWSASQEMWVSIATVYLKLSAPGIGVGFEEYDGVEISSLSGNEQLENLNGTQVIYSRGDDYVVIIGILDTAQTVSGVKLERRVPDMDFLTECDNRLWGCKYGMVNGETLNEIYCCALGDFKNWRRYMGIATDSYTASCGTDGRFTGAVTHLGYPMFFKENCFHKVYVSSSGAHQIVSTMCRGVEQGSANSLQIVGDRLFYKSRSGVCVYDGSLPRVISGNLGAETYHNAWGGSVEDKYYIRMEDSKEEPQLFCYDTKTGIWMREDNLDAKHFARVRDDLMCIDPDNRLIALRGTEGEPEASIEWFAESGMLGLATIEQKYVSKVTFRAILPYGSRISVYIEYNSDKKWHKISETSGFGTGSVNIPVQIRRCDHFRLLLKGKGAADILGISKTMERGSDLNGRLY